MKINSDFFHSGPLSFYISDKMIQQIKNLKSSISNESGYYNTMLQWKRDLNPELPYWELIELYPAMQFITMTADLNPEFIKKHNVKDYHIDLLRRLYLDLDDYYITMGFKRPFGNSHVMGDVREMMIRNGDAGAVKRDSSESNDYTVEEKVLNEFVNILSEFFKEGFKLKVRHFARISAGPFARDLSDKWKNYINFKPHSYLYSWEPNISEIREEKIKTILS